MQFDINMFDFHVTWVHYKYRGNRYTVIRRGKLTAALIPVEALRSGATLADLRKIVQALPHS